MLVIWQIHKCMAPLPYSEQCHKLKQVRQTIHYNRDITYIFIMQWWRVLSTKEMTAIQLTP